MNISKYAYSKLDYRFNGKELDPETGNYYYGARYYDPKISVWLSVDPLSHLSPNQTPYHFMSNNPIMRIDPDGLLDMNVEDPPDIRFRDENGNLIATYYTDKYDQDVVLPVSMPGTNININEQLDALDIEDIDVLSIGADWDFTAVMGGGKNVEAAFFFDGEDAGTYELFTTKRQNVGLLGGTGVFISVSDWLGNDSELNFGDYEGRSFSLSGELGTVGFSKGWAPSNPQSDRFGIKSLFDEGLRDWNSYSIGAGGGGGYQWSKQYTEKLKR